jgi:5-formyltetrahydrofolate cyclo-ligase
MLLERRDATSFDMMKIASEKIHKKLRKNQIFHDAKKIGCYYPIGSEVLTQDIMQEILSSGKELFLPKVVGEGMEFRKITDFSCLETGNFDIMEPKDDCPQFGFDSCANSWNFPGRSQIRVWSWIL